MLAAIEKISLYTKDLHNAEALYNLDEQRSFNAVCHLLLAVGEEGNKLEEKLKEELSFIAWEEIAGMRNRIAHDYRGIDKEIVYQIIKQELPTLRQALITMVGLLNTSRERLATTLNKEWYKHLQYLLS